MSFKPAKPYNTNTAGLRAKQLHPGAFCKVARDSQRADRCQVLLEVGGQTWLVASGRDWVQALERFHNFMEAANGQEAGAVEGGAVARLPDGGDAVAGGSVSP